MNFLRSIFCLDDNGYNGYDQQNSESNPFESKVSHDLTGKILAIVILFIAVFLVKLCL